MADKEKVIGHLNDCVEASRRENTWVFVRKDIVEDALSLLKEQPKMVVVQDDGCPCCPTCGNELYAFPHYQKYCDECGQELNWK